MTDGLTRTGSPRILTALALRAAELDAEDPLASYRSRFLAEPGVISYLDGNSLGRPLSATRESLGRLVEQEWSARLIRAWDERWMQTPYAVGDRIGRTLLGAAEGQTVIGDSTSVLLYKLVRAALAASGERDEIVIDTGNFPTDRFIVQGVADELGAKIHWIETDPHGGPEPEQVEAAVGSRTALVLLSHISYRSAQIADVPRITDIAHRAGALMLWDLCHSVGAVPMELDSWGVDLAVGCTYKYVNGGPGSPAFGYVNRSLHSEFQQPIWGWMGAAEPFAMGRDYAPADGIGRLLSGTPSILGMRPMQDMLDLIEEVGIAAIRDKSVRLTEFLLELHDTVLAPLGFSLASPRSSEVRGSHVSVEHPRAKELTAALWEHGVIPDFRAPRGIRLGISPLSTGFGEVYDGIAALAEVAAG